MNVSFFPFPHSYIVSSYYEIGYSSRGGNDHPTLGPMTVPVDFLTIAILSRKLPPTEIATRIDDSLDSFRESLQKMPKSEIHSHANALSSKFYLLFRSSLIIHSSTALDSRRVYKLMNCQLIFFPVLVTVPFQMKRNCLNQSKNCQRKPIPIMERFTAMGLKSTTWVESVKICHGIQPNRWQPLSNHWNVQTCWKLGIG